MAIMKKYCPQCSKPMEYSVQPPNFCPHCGHKFSSFGFDQKPPKAPQKTYHSCSCQGGHMNFRGFSSLQEPFFGSRVAFAKTCVAHLDYRTYFDDTQQIGEKSMKLFAKFAFQRR